MVGSSGLFLNLIRHDVMGRNLSRRCCSGPDSASCVPWGRFSGPPATSAAVLAPPICGLFTIVALEPLDHITDYRGEFTPAQSVPDTFAPFSIITPDG